MAGYKDKTVCVIDNGLFVQWAITLAKDFGTVYYYSPWESSFPKSNAMLIGTGLPGVNRINEFWSLLDEIDLFVFPDVYHGPLQVYLESLGKRVWGSRLGEQLELDRVGSKELCAEMGIDIGPYEQIKGLDALREYLKENDNQYVKISLTRGDMETFFSKNYKLIEPRLDLLEHTLGAKKKIIDFIVEAAIDPAVEVGYDGYTIDGQFADGAMYGAEIKDKGYIMQAGAYGTVVPGVVRSVNAKLAPVFSALHYRGFWSSEIRVTPDCTPYLIDPCARSGSPPSELYPLMVTNWADILYEGAGGVLVEPDFTASWGALLLMISEWADQNWQAVEFPPEIWDNVTLKNACKIEGRYYLAPQWTGYAEVGAVAAVGNTRDEAVAKCRKLAEQVEGHYIRFEPDSLDAAAEVMDKAKSLDGKNGG